MIYIILTSQFGDWISDVRTLIEIFVLVTAGLTSFIAYRVHVLLFNLKLQERLALLEGAREDHEKRLDKLEAKTFNQKP